MAPVAPPDATKEIELVKSLVARRFPVYDVKVDYDVVQFYCKIDETTLEENFEGLREEMSPHGYIPMVTYDKGEHIIMVARKPAAKYKSVRVNLVMLIVTFVAMMFAGIYNWASYADVPSDELYSAETVLNGILYFALPLIAILGVHELGHYFMARKRKVAASLPFFIPSFPPLGTFGAFISLRDPIPNRKSLLEIGAAGPLAGLALAIPIGILGLILTNSGAKLVPEDLGSESLVQISFPMIYLWLEELVPIQGDYLLHPTAFAAWVGFLVTALNLLPAGQLDGGHIARALFGQYAKYASWAAIAVLIAMSFFYWSWMLFALLILILGAKHPPPLNDITKLDTKRILVGVLAFIVLIVAFVPIPMSAVVTDCSFEMTAMDDTNRTIVPGQLVVFEVLVQNTGNTKENISFEKVSSPTGWVVTFGEDETNYSETYSMLLNVSGESVLTVVVESSGDSPLGNSSVAIGGTTETSASEFNARMTFNFTVMTPEVELWVSDDGQEVLSGDSVVSHLVVNNTGEGDVNLTFTARDLPGLVAVLLYEDSPDANSSGTLEAAVPASDDVTISVEVFVWASAEPGDKTVFIDVFYLSAHIGTVEVTVVVV
ncbi:MAG: site-2 protease family protein [Thermoplasmata archaeon]